MNDTALPALSDGRIDEMERALFAQIADERDERLQIAERARLRAVRRGRMWMGGAAAAAVVAVAAVIAPQVVSSVGGSAGSVAVAPASDGSFLLQGTESGREPGSISGADSAGGLADEALTGVSAVGGDADAEREITASASATVEVEDAAAAADAIGAAAVSAGGFVESMSVGGAAAATHAVDGMMLEPSYPTPLGGAWITVRVPADQLTATLAGLAEVGTVTSSQIDRRDVTTEAVDLRARVGALEASVARLTELVGQSTSTADLIAAESALSQRQSELDSLRQQLTWLEGQVDMSSVTVSLVEPAPAVNADPAGFGDGVSAGWNGLVATLNGLVVAIGFLLPWLGVLAVAGLIVWSVRAAVRRRRAARTADMDAAGDAREP
ncbi:DUF4349 domain-containing protein [Microbacterium sp.]|uniref:DUF4349 domain-containing protein n=1 Tax=Microbacterium sp. TaxID=51671 RepID=UPI0028990883|nr:DUF4349 domain-containing protein [Microbacterium sp.]